MGRPKLANTGKKVTLYLRGEHLNVLRRYSDYIPDAIRAMIRQVASNAPPPPAPADPPAVATPSLCPACDLLDRPACPACLAAFPEW